MIPITVKGAIEQRPRNNPLYDRVLADGETVRFFRDSIGATEADGHVKTAADTNILMQPYGDNAAPLPHGWAMHAYGIYMCPCLREVQEERLTEVRQRIAAIRWQAACSLRFGPTIHTEVPAACVLANLLGGEPEVEAVPIVDNVRVIDVTRRDGRRFYDEWRLKSRDPQAEDGLISERNQFSLTIASYPIEIMSEEDWHVRLERVPLGAPAHVRVFVNGILLKGISG